MTTWDGAVSAEAWDDLVQSYRDAGGEDADDHTLAEMVRNKVHEVEG